MNIISRILVSFLFIGVLCSCAKNVNNSINEGYVISVPISSDTSIEVQTKNNKIRILDLVTILKNGKIYRENLELDQKLSPKKINEIISQISRDGKLSPNYEIKSIYAGEEDFPIGGGVMQNLCQYCEGSLNFENQEIFRETLNDWKESLTYALFHANEGKSILAILFPAPPLRKQDGQSIHSLLIMNLTIDKKPLAFSKENLELLNASPLKIIKK